LLTLQFPAADLKPDHEKGLAARPKFTEKGRLRRSWFANTLLDEAEELTMRIGLNLSRFKLLAAHLSTSHYQFPLSTIKHAVGRFAHLFPVLTDKHCISKGCISRSR
jgi:hypothetical protein